MGVIVRCCTAFDAFIQAAFDRTCFFLMRRFGTQKSFIRYVLFTAFILGLTGVTVCEWQLHQDALGAVVHVLIAAGAFRWQVSCWRQDTIAEKRGMLSPVDGSMHRSSLATLVKVVMWLLLIMSTMTLIVSPELPVTEAMTAYEAHVTTYWFHRNAAFTAVVSAAVLALAYLDKTPRTPPVIQRATVPVPAPVRTT